MLKSSEKNASSDNSECSVENLGKVYINRHRHIYNIQYIYIQTHVYIYIQCSIELAQSDVLSDYVIIIHYVKCILLQHFIII